MLGLPFARSAPLDHEHICVHACPAYAPTYMPTRAHAYMHALRMHLPICLHVHMRTYVRWSIRRMPVTTPPPMGSARESGLSSRTLSQKTLTPTLPKTRINSLPNAQLHQTPSYTKRPATLCPPSPSLASYSHGPSQTSTPT